jgi:uncharacterized protein YndB with AHSA1/START domain
MEKPGNGGQEKVLEMVELFDATPERVFEAWTDRKAFMSWYGPEGCTTTFCEMDVRVGGAWRACIQSPQGDEYWMEGKYIEITRPSKLVFTYGDGSGKPKMGETLVTIQFKRVGDKTQMLFRQTDFPTKELRDSHYGGWSSAFRCLGTYLR